MYCKVTKFNCNYSQVVEIVLNPFKNVTFPAFSRLTV